MPLLDHFRLLRRGKAFPVEALASPQTGPASRLHRVVSRQRGGRVPTDLEERLQALETEYSEPLYGASAYGSPPSERSED